MQLSNNRIPLAHVTEAEHQWSRDCPGCLMAYRRHLYLRNTTCFPRDCEPDCVHADKALRQEWDVWWASLYPES